MTFTSLKEDVRRYLERGYVDDTTVYEQLPRLINLAERAIATELKFQGFASMLQPPRSWLARASTRNQIVGARRSASASALRKTTTRAYSTVR